MADNVAYNPSGTTLFATTDDGTAHHQKVLIEGTNAGGTIVSPVKAEDDASASGDGGIVALAVQKASPADSAGTDGDYSPLQMSGGRLFTSATIDAALPAGTNVIGHVIADSGSTTAVTGNVTVVQGTAANLKVDPSSVTSPVSIADGSNTTFGAKTDAKSTATDATSVSAMQVLKQISASVQAPPSQAVTNAGTFPVQDSEKIADNAPFTDGTTKLMPAGYIYDEAAGTALTENDIAAPRINANRATIAILEDPTTRGRTATVTAGNALKVDGSAATQPVSGTVTASNTAGDVAHDGVDSGNPIKNGGRAIDHGTNPTAVAAADRTDWLFNRAGVPFVMGGHPNIITVKHTTVTTAVTDSAVITVSSGTKIVVTSFMFTLDNASTVFPTVLLGFGTANTPTTTGVIGAHGGVPAGGGFGRGDGSGIIGIGADNEELRLTTTGNATGNGLQLVVTYYTVPA